MSAYYWVGGSATWDATAGSKWSSSSGGAASYIIAPTINDDVYFTAGSGTVNVVFASGINCRSLNFTGFTGSFTGASAANQVNIYGGLTMGTGMTVPAATNVFNFAATTTNAGAGHPITTNGKTLPNVTFNGVGGKWQLQDTVTLGTNGVVTLTNGTLDTNNQAINCTGFTIANGTKTLTLGSSTVTLNGFNYSALNSQYTTNFTVTTNTATFVMTGSGALATVFDVNWRGASISFTGAGVCGFGNSAGTWANVTRTGTAATTDSFLITTAGPVVTGTLTITGNSSTNRVLCYSDTLGTPRVITAAAVSLTDVDFMDISIVGPVGSTITSDSFNRADGALGTTDAAAGGSPIAWNTSALTIASNKIGPSANSSSTALLNVGVSDMSVGVTVSALPSSGHGGLVVRWGGNLGTNIQFVVGNASTPARLQCTVGYVGYADLTMGLVAAGSTLELRVIGSAAVALVNGVVFGTINLPSVLPASTTAGLIFQSAAIFDDFIVKNLVPVTGTRLGDCLGNSGITFTTASGTARDGGGAGVKRYAVAAGNFSSTATWSESDGGAPGASVPLPQDDVYLTANSGAGTYTVDMPRVCRNFDCTGFTRTLAASRPMSYYGSHTLSSASFCNETGYASYYRGRGSHTITTAGIHRGEIAIAAPGGTYTLADSLTCSLAYGVGFSLTAGTFNSANYNIDVGNTFVVSGTLTKSMILGTSTVIARRGRDAPFDFFAMTGTTISAASATLALVVSAAADRYIYGGGNTFGAVTYTVADSPGALIITGANTFGTINIGAGRSVKLPVNTITTVGTLNVAGVARGGVRLPGVSGTYLSTPDSAAVSVTGDIDIRCRVALPDYTIASDSGLVTKYGAAGQRSFRFYFDSVGRLNFNMSTDGTANTGLQWQAGPTFVDGTTYWVRTTRTAAGTLRFFYAADQPTMPTSWTEAGLSQTLSAGQNIFDSTSPVEIGSMTLGTAYLANGVFYRAQIRNNVLDDGSGIVFDTDLTVPFGPRFYDSVNGAAITPSNTLANVGDGRVVIESSTAGTGATLNVSNAGQLEGVDIKDVTINGPVTLGAQAVVRTNVRGVCRSPRQGIMV